MHLANSRRHDASGSRAHRFRRVIASLVASALLLVGAAAPMTAAGPTKSASPWSKAPDRTVTKRHVPSVKAAARLSVGNPRNAGTKLRPLLRASKGAARTGRALSPSPTTSSIRPLNGGGAGLLIGERFAGLNEGEGGGYTPPDPWVGVNSSHVVQTVNSTVRISNRLGSEISSVPTWAFFALPITQSPTDPRVIWDAVHGRWVGILASYEDGDTLDLLNLAVSDSADPTAGWSIFAIPFANEFPDFPSVASSTDKIVMTANMFDGSGFLAADIITVTWASIIAGAAPAVHFCEDSNFITPRAAQVLTPGADVHVIAESSDALDPAQWYFRVKGTGRCDSLQEIVDGTDLGSTFDLPPNPRQAGGAFGDFTIDERPTDAIWQNGKLWWVSTIPVSYDGGATTNDGVALWSASTATSGPPTPAAPQIISAGNGIDSWMGGIGLTRNGTLVSIYSQSSSSSFVSMESNRIPPGGSLGSPVHLDDGNATYTADRWGDFAGVATDPVGTGAVWATHEVAAADGSWRTDVVRLVADNDVPSLPGVPRGTIVAPSVLGSSVPVRLSWTPATDTLSGTVTYLISQSVDDGFFYEETSVTGTTAVRQLLVGHVYSFAVRAVDPFGNTGATRYSPSVTLSRYQQNTSTTYVGSWSTTTNASYSGGSSKHASIAGRTATFTATNARSIALVGAKGPTRGSFRVYIDGVLKATVSSYSSTTRYRQILYQFNWASPGTHKMKIYVKGTAGHPRVDVDAWVVLR